MPSSPTRLAGGKRLWTLSSTNTTQSVPSLVSPTCYLICGSAVESLALEVRLEAHELILNSFLSVCPSSMCEKGSLSVTSTQATSIQQALSFHTSLSIKNVNPKRSAAKSESAFAASVCQHEGPNKSIQLVHEIESQAVVAQQQIGLTRSQMTAKQRDQRLTSLTLNEIADLTDDAVVYEGVGKMYVFPPVICEPSLYNARYLPGSVSIFSRSVPVSPSLSARLPPFLHPSPSVFFLLAAFF